jgi:hypothetical protein
MKKTILLGGLASALIHSTGFAANDSCEDYHDRHYKADLVPVRVYTESVPRQGDIAGFDTLNVLVKNVGVEAIQGPSGNGVFSANAITIAVRRASTRPYRPGANVTRYYQTTIAAPLQPGGTRLLSVAIPQGSIGNCSKMRVTIEARQTANQHGCQVYANDGENFVVQQRGALICAALGPIPTFPQP